MTDFQPPPKNAHIQDELVRLTENAPEIVGVGVYDFGGGSIGFVNPKGALDERRAEAMFQSSLSMSERVVGDLRLGQWAHYVTSNAQGMGFCLPLGDDHLLYLIARAALSPDDLLTTLKPYCETLLELIKQLPPKPPPVQQPSDPDAIRWLESLGHDWKKNDKG